MIASAMESAEQNNADLKQSYASANQIATVAPVSSNADVNRMVIGKSSQPPPRNRRKCYRCGKNHDPQDCRYKTAECYKCHKVGHIAPVCKETNTSRSVKYVQKENEHSSTESLNLYVVNSQTTKKSDYVIPVKIWNNELNMILDTAADVSTIGKPWINRNIPWVKINRTVLSLLDYNKADVHLEGMITVPVMYKGQKEDIDLYIVDGDRPALFGKNCIMKFNMDWNDIFTVKTVMKGVLQEQNDIFKRYAEVFCPNDRPIGHFKANIKLTSGHAPCFRKSRNVPYALKMAVEQEIKKACDLGVWKFVQHSKWATPIVIVPKKNGSIRICGDFKISINQCMDINQYPLPTQQDLFTALNGGRYFTKLDLKNAYQQVQLDESSQDVMTLNTHMGLIRPARLLYGVSSASAIFQHIMDQILLGLKQVICFQDDILVIGTTREEHDENLNAVLCRLQKYNVKLNREKCSVAKSKIEYLGHIVDEQGIHPTEEKISAIKKIPSPESVTQLRSFLGILNYYIKFIKDASTILSPLYELLKKDVKWKWDEECERVFRRCKQILTSKTVLVHYDPKKKLKLACDASPFGVGAIISHIMQDGEERPVAYASRTLTSSESNYPQIEREALSIVFGLQKFEQYLFGREFTIVTDHKPLIAIFGPKTATPVLAAARLQRWALLLSTFHYSIEYKRGDCHANVDALSRLPMQQESDGHNEVFQVSFAEHLPVCSINIARATRDDTILGRVHNYVKYGWVFPIKHELEPYFARREQLSLENGCVLLGMRVIIPMKFRGYMLDLLHDTHPGITKMKTLARSHIWWPGLDSDIESLSQNCTSCIQQSKMPPATPMQSWVWPKGPWHRVHIDFAKKDSNYFLVIVDAHSKWIEVERMASTTTEQTIIILRKMFSRYGLPLEIVSDNGPQLISDEFVLFLKLNGIKQTLIPAYHPQSNGAAERAVQYFKSALNKMNTDTNDPSSLDHKISRFLFAQHVTQHATTGSAPCDLFMGRPLRTKLSLVHVDVGKVTEERQRMQKYNYDRQHTQHKTIYVGDKVWVKRHKTNDSWKKGLVKRKVGSNTWEVDMDGSMKLIHTDQIKKDWSTDTEEPSSNNTLSNSDIEEDEEIRNSNTQNVIRDGGNTTDIDIADTMGFDQQDSEMKAGGVTDDTSIKAEPRYPVRIKKKPDRLNL